MTQYAVKKYGQDYDIDPILDLMDSIIVPISKKVEWGYSVPYFISAIHNAHTFNVKQLLKRHNIKSKDLRKIIEMLDETQKRAYDYSLLEKLYVQYFNHPVDDHEAIDLLSKAFAGKSILLIGPGKSAITDREKIENLIQEKNPIVIGINNLISDYKLDYVFYSGVNRYQNLQYQDYRKSGSPRIILSSNIKTEAEDNELIVDYLSLIKFGWVNIDSSAILLLRLLIRCGVSNVDIAGFDGYDNTQDSFYNKELDTGLDAEEKSEHTKDNLSMLQDIKENNKNFNIHFITKSVYDTVFQG
jgi:4-hydroxy 2-oxovalerate aldolase